MQIVRTHDMALVHRIMTHPRIWPWLHDDNGPPPRLWMPVDDPASIYLTPIDPEPMGVFLARPVNSVTYDVHTALLPESWGPRALDAGRRAQRWMWRNTPARKLLTWVPDGNRRALAFALTAGFKVEGRARGAWLKGGALRGMTLLGLCWEGGTCQRSL